jgi:hypothetical protein
MRRLFLWLLAASFIFSLIGIANASVYLYVDAAPNAFGSADYEPWKEAAFASAADGSFVNMASGINPDNVGTTNFEIQDEVVYSFGDLGKRLTWIYWIPETNLEALDGKFEISLTNTWDGDVLDFYLDYYGSTWLVPTKWENYEGGVIGTAGMAWWGAYEENTQEALDADLAAWAKAEETWIFTARFLDDDGNVTQTDSLTSYRAPVPEPATILLFAAGLLGIAGLKRNFKKS